MTVNIPLEYSQQIFLEIDMLYALLRGNPFRNYQVTTTRMYYLIIAAYAFSYIIIITHLLI